MPNKLEGLSGPELYKVLFNNQRENIDGSLHEMGNQYREQMIHVGVSILEIADKLETDWDSPEFFGGLHTMASLGSTLMNRSGGLASLLLGQNPFTHDLIEVLDGYIFLKDNYEEVSLRYKEIQEEKRTKEEEEGSN